MAGLLPVRTVADGRGRTVEGVRRDGGEVGGREGREGSARRTAGGHEADGERARRDDPVALRTCRNAAPDPAGRAPLVLLPCGRAPGRALLSGRRESASMGAAWVGPLHWTQWAGGHCRLIPRRRRTGPGGVPRLPDRARNRRRNRCGSQYGVGADSARQPCPKPQYNGASCATFFVPSSRSTLREWPNDVGRSGLSRAIRGHSKGR